MRNGTLNNGALEVRLALRIKVGKLAFIETAQHSVHPTGGSLRVFKQFTSLEVGSDKMALPLPAHHRVTQAVRLGVPSAGPA
jgi:hypothetical protein